MEGKINLNTATEKEVLNIHGIPDAVAQQILIHRKFSGEIKKWEDLQELPGMTESLMETLKHRATLN